MARDYAGPETRRGGRSRVALVVQRGMEDLGTSNPMARAAGLEWGSCVAIVGAGGKTSVMLSLAEMARRSGLRTLVTTTTKIWPPHDLPVVLASDEAETLQAVEEMFGRFSVTVLGGHLGPEGKLHGIAPELVCGLLTNSPADLILCEADGAAGRSVKAHRAGEPVIPVCSTSVVVLAGVDAVSRPATASVVHRLEEFCRITGTRPGDAVRAEHIAFAMMAAASYAPPSATVVYVLNKVEDAASREAADEVTQELERLAPGARVLLTQRGRPEKSFGYPRPAPALDSR